MIEFMQSGEFTVALAVGLMLLGLGIIFLAVPNDYPTPRHRKEQDRGDHTRP